MTSFKAALDAIEHSLYNCARIIACVALTAMVALTFVDVVGRQFHSAVPGASEIISMLLGISFFAGMSMVARENAHILVGIAVDRYPPALRAVEGLVTRVVSALSMALIAWLTFSQARKLSAAQSLTEFLSFKLAYLAYLMAALAGIATIQAFRSRPQTPKPHAASTGSQGAQAP